MTLEAEFFRADRWHARLQRAAVALRTAEGEAAEEAFALEYRYGVLPPGELRSELERELQVAIATQERLGIVEVEIEGALQLDEREALYRGLSIMVDRPGDIMGRTDRGVQLLFTWCDDQTARALSSVAASIANHELPDRHVRHGFRLVDETHGLAPIELADAAQRAPTIYRSRGR